MVVKDDPTGKARKKVVRVKKVRVKRKKKIGSSNMSTFDKFIYGLSSLDFTSVVIFVSCCALSLYFYGFYVSIQSLTAIDEESHNLQNAPNTAAALSPKFNSAGSNNVSSSSVNTPKIRNFSSSSKISSVNLPKATWPVSIRDEDGNFEDIVHPGDLETLLSVPKFWSPPLKGRDGKVGSLITREVATQFGSYTNGKTDTDWKHKGNPDERTIFIAIASYRDWQCRYTVESIFNRAKYPERVRVAIVDQIDDGDPSCGVAINPCESNPNQSLCQYVDQVDVFEVPAEYAVGPVFARHIGHRMYRGEYYAMQIDAHVTFVTDWDVDIIEQFEATNNEMAVLSTYLTDIVGSIDEKTGLSKRHTRPIMCNTDYEGGQGGNPHLRHLSQPEAPAPIKDSPQMQPYWAAGWSFSRGHFVTNIPYDLHLPMIFMGEESSIGIRGFTFGYDHYAPQRSICFHTYANGENAAARSKVKHFWEHASLYKGVGVGAMTRLLGIIGMIPEVDPSTWNHKDADLYGVGTERPLSKFFDTFGIDVHAKKVQHHLCTFVQPGKMHRMFLKQLRPDGMGIDYSKIDYRFVDPRPGQK